MHFWQSSSFVSGIEWVSGCIDIDGFNPYPLAIDPLFELFPE
jgi:hypothetical protein